MDQNEIETLVQKLQELQTETETIEVKSASKGCPSKLYDSFSSFANQDQGGCLVFGMDERENFKVCGVYDAADLQKQVNNKAKEMEPVIRPEISHGVIDGKNIIVAEIVPVSYEDRPVYYKPKGIHKGSYVRVGDSDELMTAYEIYKFEAYRKGLREDQRVVETGWVLPNKKRIESFLKNVKEQRQNLFEHLSDNEILQLQNVMKEEKPTLAGLLVFSDYPQAAFPGLAITAISVPGKEVGDAFKEGIRFLDNRRIEGSIPAMLEEAMKFVDQNTKTRTIININGQREDRKEYPMRAVREAILNALIHRDYSRHTDGTPIQIIILEDRMEIRNSGGIYGGLAVERLGKESTESRNSSLIRLLELLGISENRYSGIPTMRKEMEKAGLPSPEFIDNGRQFTAIFRNEQPASAEKSVSTLSGMDKKILSFCQVARSRKQIADYLGRNYSYVSNSLIKPLLAQGLLISKERIGRIEMLIANPELSVETLLD